VVMQKITPHLWFDKEAKEAAEFYVSVFDNSSINSITPIHDSPSGAFIVAFQIMGYEFMAISAGPYFKINPSISFHVKCATVEEVDRIWEKLSAGGTALMELGEYPFSKRYGWIQDKFGVSWQVIYNRGRFRAEDYAGAVVYRRCGGAGRRKPLVSTRRCSETPERRSWSAMWRARSLTRQER